MVNIHVKLYGIWTVVQKMLFKEIFYLELWQPLCSADQIHLCNFRGRYHEERFCEIILNLDQWFKEEMLFKGISYLELWQAFCLAECNHLGRGCNEEPVCEIILNLGQWFRKRCRLKGFLPGALAALLWMEQNHLCNFERGHHQEHSHKVI